MRRSLFVLLALAPLAAAAQDLPIRWGDLTDRDKATTDWPDDPDATAVILGDVGLGEIYVGGDVEYRLRRHRRVRVLDEAGYALGEVSFRYPEGDDVRRVRGQTFVPDGQGGYRRVELSGRDIFDEEVEDGVREVRFSMPALAPDVIFEYEYFYETDRITVLPDWHFQSEEPTVASLYRFRTPQYFNYITLSQGGRKETEGPTKINGMAYDSMEQTWVAYDVPALRDEPYTTTESDYVERIGLQLAQVNRPDGFRDDVLTTWEAVAEELRDHPEFGRRVRRNRRARELAEGVEGTAAEKARALYDLVRTDYVWNEKGGVFADRDLDDIVETRSGSAGELTHLLLALYAEAGVPATPVLLSSRSNGRAILEYPILRQFDRMLLLVQIPGEPVALVDPTSRHRPYGQVPVDALNGQAWLVDYEGPQWIEFSAPGGTSTTTYVEAALGEDGALAGRLQLRLSGYDATAARVRLAEAEAGPPAAAGEAVAETADADDGVEIEVVEVTGVDEVDDDLNVTAAFDGVRAEVVGDEMYLTPFVAMQLEENPFERETREFPVDFAYPFERTYVANITLPEGWTAVDLPEPVRMTIPSRAVTYQRAMVSPFPNQLQVRAVLTVAASQVQPAEYPSLRDLYDEIVAAETEAVVIARASELAEGEGTANTEPADAETGEADGR